MPPSLTLGPQEHILAYTCKSNNRAPVQLMTIFSTAGACTCGAGSGINTAAAVLSHCKTLHSFVIVVCGTGCSPAVISLHTLWQWRTGTARRYGHSVQPHHGVVAELQFSSMQDQLFHRCMHLPVALAAVSDAAAAVLGSQFGRAPVLLPNGVDCTRFSPGARSPRPASATLEPDPALDLDIRFPGGVSGAAQTEQSRSVLLVGNPALPLKGFDVALAVLAAVGRVLRLEVTWVCQARPSMCSCPLPVAVRSPEDCYCIHAWRKSHAYKSPALIQMPVKHRARGICKIDWIS